MNDVIVTLIWLVAIVGSAIILVGGAEVLLIRLRESFRAEPWTADFEDTIRAFNILLTTLSARLAPPDIPDTDATPMPVALRTWIETWDESWAIEGQTAYAQELYNEVKDWSKVRMMMEKDAVAPRGEE